MYTFRNYQIKLFRIRFDFPMESTLFHKKKKHEKELITIGHGGFGDTLL